MKSKRIEAWHFDSAQMDVINRFCANDLQVLRSIVDPILKRFYDIDRDEAYGLAMEILMQCVEDYDHERGAKLNTYFRRIFARAAIDWYRDGHTYEKCNFETEFKDGKRLRVKDEENKRPIRNTTSLWMRRYRRLKQLWLKRSFLIRDLKMMWWKIR